MPEGTGGQHVGPAFHRHLEQHGAGVRSSPLAVNQRHRMPVPVKGRRHVLAAGEPVAAVADAEDRNAGAGLRQGAGIVGRADGFAGVAPADQDVRANGRRVPAFGNDQDRASRAADQLLLQLAVAVPCALRRALPGQYKVRGGHIVEQEILGALAAQRLLPEIKQEIPPGHSSLKGFCDGLCFLLLPIGNIRRAIAHKTAFGAGEGHLGLQGQHAGQMRTGAAGHIGGRGDEPLRFLRRKERNRQGLDSHRKTP